MTKLGIFLILAVLLKGAVSHSEVKKKLSVANTSNWIKIDYLMGADVGFLDSATSRDPSSVLVMRGEKDRFRGSLSSHLQNEIRKAEKGNTVNVLKKGKVLLGRTKGYFAVYESSAKPGIFKASSVLNFKTRPVYMQLRTKRKAAINEFLKMVKSVKYE